ncbi:hypothetical protein FSARC_8547 [Fusarium sarcochroum]|uniref:Zn(2)-C6 fungal-type domain-containing protein n=1 Tax=Fusarium sarcochroum TaxID=1208366 RepID=A0A8H4TSW2_9HYPO|nr:hypothetical protein FSARC_8547 [Fusarium sarcochroum]
MTDRKRSTQGRTKVKTGCATCRIRKIKCDEGKPSCQKCIKTGRTCDGYESPFRVISSQPINNNPIGGIKLDVSPEPTQPTAETAPLDVKSLNRIFSIKTILDVDLGCEQEASQVLQASSTDATLRHALLSLRALREDFESTGVTPKFFAKQTPSYNYGLQQYSMALSGLASNLSTPSPEGLKSVLLCCQVLISVEQVRGNFAAMGLHIIRGLSIMREYRARPHLTTANKLVPAPYSQLPLLDVFMIKMFIAPCKFAEPSAAVDLGGVTPPAESSSCYVRKIAPNMRTELTRIATSTMVFLAKVSQVKSAESALQLLSEKEVLLVSLDSWQTDLERTQMENAAQGPEPVKMFFLQFFHRILNVVLLGVLDSPPDLSAKLRIENEQLQGVANDVSERLKAYVRGN